MSSDIKEQLSEYSSSKSRSVPSEHQMGAHDVLQATTIVDGQIYTHSISKHDTGNVMLVHNTYIRELFCENAKVILLSFWSNFKLYCCIALGKKSTGVTEV